jgi:hypothetical protein
LPTLRGIRQIVLLRPAVRAVLVIGASAATATGCGPTDNAELKRRIQTLDAIAVEARMLADGVIGDRTKATFTRVHARTLAESATHEAEKMADAKVLPRLEREREQAVAIAQRLSDAIAVLQVYPGAENKARDGGDEIRRLAGEAQRLDESIPDTP